MSKFVVDVEVTVTKRVTVEADNREHAAEVAAEEVEDDLGWDSKSFFVDDVYVVGEVS